MHELIIVEGIINTVSQYAEKENRRIRRIKVLIGELASFNKTLIEELFIELKRGTILEDAEINIEVERADVGCQTCRKTWRYKDLIEPLSDDEREMIHFIPELIKTYTKCPECGSRTLEIKSGRSIRIGEIEII
jgi:hydrogenase nickel incorporation protein HypA/HybF